jgi:hypothetical protein
MKYINEQKVIDKLRELLGARCMDLQVEFGNSSAVAVFSLSDVCIPKNNLPYLNLKDLNNVADEFGDNEIEFRVGVYRMVIGFLVNNEEDYYD